MDLAALRELAAWMRREGVLYARTGELELRLGPPPRPVVASVDTPADSPDADDDGDGASLETLLYSSGVDPEPFRRAIRGARHGAKVM